MRGIDWTIGVEIELLAPKGASRETLARHVAERTGGSATRIFHPESETSAVPGQPVFENLTLGYRVQDAEGNWLASFVDDLTLQRDLDKRHAAQPGWFRLVADDPRLLRLAMRHCDASAPLDAVLDPLAALFGTAPQQHPGGMVRVVDAHGASVAIGAPLPGERERPCEIVTAPMAENHLETLGALLGDARALGFTLPHEGATHIHFDAAPMRSAKAVSRLVAFYETHHAALRAFAQSNPACVRLGGWPPELSRLTADPAFLAMEWPDAARRLAEVGLKKWCDINLANLVNAPADKDTVEFRIFPSTLDANDIMRWARGCEAILRFCLDPAEPPIPQTAADLIEAIPQLAVSG
ncbi:MAG: hypothetical protein GW855_05280 [Erythrobacter sp.]|nr:hypothetical protein [Erythrobacter sp.]NCQ65042.1 hypothetical protein [Alphaproteobacteria bacterium]